MLQSYLIYNIRNDNKNKKKQEKVGKGADRGKGIAGVGN